MAKKYNFSLVAALGVASGAILSSAPAQAATLNGTIGFGGEVQVVATGLCAKVGGATGEAVLCTDADAITTQPLTTLDFQDLTGAPGFPQAGFGGEVAISDATGDFAAFDPPPLAFGQVRDLPVGVDFTPNDWIQAFYGPTGGAVPGSGEPALAYSFDLLTLDFPEYVDTSTGVTINLGYELRITRVADGAVGTGTGTFSGDILEIDGVCGDILPECDPGVVQSYLAVAGNAIPGADGDPGISWSTTVEVSGIAVPESSNVLGLITLGLLGGGLMLQRQGKKLS